MPELSNPIKEAERYLQNAKQLLSENAGKEGNYYSDRKYVKLAGHAAWSAVLVALDGAFNVKKSKRSRVSIDDYINAVGKIDKKMPRYLSNAYDTLHLSLGYDGNLNYGIVQGGLKEAQDMINWAAKYYKSN
jgi:hypothetical protein